MAYLVRSWVESDLIEAVKVSDSISEVVRRLGLKCVGGNHGTVRRHVARLGLDTSHFTRGTKARGYRKPKLDFDDVFRENSGIRFVAKYVRRFSVLKYECVECGNQGSHNGKPLVLQIDHLNGVSDDNRVSNIRYLCPNCHSQTPTFSGRANRRPPRVMQRKPIVARSSRKVPYELLAVRHSELGSYSGVAREFGVSDVTVRNAVQKISEGL